MDMLPLGPVEMDYSFTARGRLPKKLETSALAAAFGPERGFEERQSDLAVTARIQVGDALVALLEGHRQHRCVANALLGVTSRYSGTRASLKRGLLQQIQSWIYFCCWRDLISMTAALPDHLP